MITRTDRSVSTDSLGIIRDNVNWVNFSLHKKIFWLSETKTSAKKCEPIVSIFSVEEVDWVFGRVDRLVQTWQDLWMSSMGCVEPT